MTTPHRPDHVPTTPSGADTSDTADPLGLSQLIATGVIDVVPGDPPVPITVWRVADPHRPFSHDPADGLTGRTAQLLVGLYTRPGDTVVSLGNDPAIAGAAGAGGCRYLPVHSPDRLADLDHVAGAVRLLILRWPPVDRPPTKGTGADGNEIVDLFTACRMLLAHDGYTIVAVAPAAGQHIEHAWQLVPAARQAGLGWVEQIVAITAPIIGDHISVPAAPADPATLRLARDVRVHIDLYVFVIRGGRRA